MMEWQRAQVAEDGTHHTVGGRPLYVERFDEVLKFHPPGLAPVRRAGEAWHIDAGGRPAYERRFARTFGYYHGRAAVEGDRGFHHILPDGRDLYPERHEWCGNYQEGRCPVRDVERRYHHVDLDGRSVYAERWRYAGDYRDGIAVVQADDGRSTHIDAAGRALHGGWFLDLDVFHKGFARARDGDGWLHVDLRGRPVYARRFAAVEPFYNGQARVSRVDGGLEVIDEHGHAVVELRPALRDDFAALSSDLVGFWRTRAIHAAVRLGVLEALPGTAREVAAQCGLDPQGTFRLLRALGELGLALLEGETWRLTARGGYLRRDHPCSLAGAASEYGEHFNDLWSALPEALRAGSRWSPPDIFGQVAADAGRTALHHTMLASYARHDYEAVPEALHLRGGEVVIDAGGGVGVLSGLLLQHYPTLRAVLIDRPEVVALAAVPEAVRDRFSTKTADLFEPWNVSADAVILARILHDWDDERALGILRNAWLALKPGGTVFLVEMLLPEGGVAGALCDLHLWMATGGQERTASEYAALLDRAGFELKAVKKLAALPSVVVGARRAAAAR